MIPPTRSAGEFLNLFNQFKTSGIIASSRPETGEREILGTRIAVRGTEEPWQVIYGTTRVGGIITFTTTDVEAGGEYLHSVITYAGHRCKNIIGLYLDDQLIPFATPSNPSGWSTGDWALGPAGYVYLSKTTRGDTNQSANPELVSQSSLLFPGKWGAQHRQRGLAHAYLILYFNADKFPNGFPQIKLQVEGKDDIYDPRDSTLKYTDNAALIIADYLCDATRGLGVDYATEINEANLIEAANLCDETVSLAAGGTEKRYTINGVFDLDNSPQQTLKEMVSAIGGDIAIIGGEFFIFPATWRAPVITLTEDDLRGPIQIETMAPGESNFNAVKGTFISPNHNYEVTDYPPVTNAFYESQDGDRQVFEDIAQAFVNTPSRCQRLAKIELERKRQPITVKGVFALRAFHAQVCDNVYLDLSRLGWSGKPFEIRNTQLTQAGSDLSIGVELTLQETASAVFDWNTGHETTVDVAPNTVLPSPNTVVAPTGLTLESGSDHLDIRADGTIFSRLKVSWTQPADPFVHSGGSIEIQYKKSSNSTWRSASPVPGDSTEAYILDVVDLVNYDVRIRSVNGLGNRSSWLQSLFHLVEGKSAAPADVTNFRAEVSAGEVRLLWDAIPDLDVAEYEIRKGAGALTDWADAVAFTARRGTDFVWNPQGAGSYYFQIRARDTSENLSASAVRLTVTIPAPGAPVVTAEISGPNVLLSWTEPSSDFTIEDYEIRAGATFAGATTLARVKGTGYSHKADYSGAMTFYVTAKDVAQNDGTTGEVAVDITEPGAIQSYTSQIVGNNVLLKWSAPATGTLPIDHYKVYKGATFGAAVLIGQLASTFQTIFETTAGTYTYWVVAVDSAGNVGPESSTAAAVSNPPGYVLRADTVLDPNDATLTNLFIEPSNAVIGPINDTETFEEHFIDNGFTTIQDAIDAGYTIWGQPTPGYAIYEQEVDYGAVLGATLITFSWVEEWISGTLPIVCTISVKELSGDAWTDYEDVTQVFVSGFQFVKYKLVIGTEPTAGVPATGEPFGPMLPFTYA